MASVVLRVNGREYAGWTSARVTRGIEAISGAFDLTVSDRWSGQTTPWPILEEDACELAIGDTTLITGHVDRRSLSYGAEEHALSVAGRDLTGALVDCSAVLDKWEFRGVPVLTLAQRLVEPFKIPVSLQPGLTPPPPPAKLTVDPGDTAFEALERTCRMAGLLPVSDGRGGLVLTRVGTARAVTELVEGKNIKAASADFDAAGRFRRYVVSGQHAGGKTLAGKGAAAVRAEALDLAVRRSERVMLIRPESGATTAYAKQRAAWEAKLRAARGASVRVTVQGWHQGDGSLWPVNALVRIRSPLLALDEDLLITEAAYSLDDSSGTITELALKRPDAYLPEPEIPARKEPGRTSFAPA